MTAQVKPIRSNADYEAALEEIERLWGAKAGTCEGDRLDVLATLVDAFGYVGNDFALSKAEYPPAFQQCLLGTAKRPRNAQ
jgi:antitoxin component HigA of HigAB toxin-antitoxin module